MLSDARPWTYAALFGALWGSLELSLGTVLHLGDVPMKGALMGAIGIVCLVCLRRLQPHRGICLTAGAVAVFLKVFTLGGFYPGPLIGIAAEALLVELAFIIGGSCVTSSIAGGALALAVNPLQKVIMTWIVAGPEAVRAAVQMIRTAAGHLGVHGIDGVTILIGLSSFHAVIGGVVGAMAWALSGRVLRRLGRAP